MIDPGLLERLKNLATENNLTLTRVDNEKPWGGEFYFDEDQIEEFASVFFPRLSLPPKANRPKMSPKFLIVAPHSKLSWQYHHRRGEQWQVLEGPVGVITSYNDEQGEVRVLNAGDNIEMKVGERHRLVGLDNWGVVPEIWQHAELNDASDEKDIVRLQDDYKR